MSSAVHRAGGWHLTAYLGLIGYSLGLPVLILPFGQHLRADPPLPEVLTVDGQRLVEVGR